MASSGVKPDTSTVDKFNRLKLRKEYRYLLLQIVEDKRIVVFEEGPKDASKQAFIDALSRQKTCCYGVFDNGKIVLITWNPESATAKSKMLVASSSDALRQAFGGIGLYLNVTDVAELKDKLGC